MSIPYQPPPSPPKMDPLPPTPPTILIHPFAAAPSPLPPVPAAHPAPQLSTYTPSSRPVIPAAAAFPLPPVPAQAMPNSPLPAYEQGDWRTAAEQEKDAYLARGSDDSHGGHWADAPPSQPYPVGSHPPLQVQTRGPAPPPILLPPKAAFAGSPTSPMSPLSLKQAIEFGDVSSVKDGYGGASEKVAGRGGAEVRQSGLDWDRFGMMAQQSEKGQQSDWLKRKTKNSKRWFIIGWIGAILVIIAIIAALAYHFTHKSDGDGEPTIPSLGGLNDKSILSASSSTTRASSAAQTSASVSHVNLSSVDKASTTARAAASTTAADEDEDEVSSTRSTTRAVAETASTTSARAATTTTAKTTAAARTTASESASSSTTTARSARETDADADADADADERRRLAKRYGTAWKDIEWTKAGAAKEKRDSDNAAHEHARLAKRFGTWEAIEWKKPGAAEAHVEEKRSGNWQEIEFTKVHQRRAAGHA
ncbi:hypothetical protein JCM10207_005681 [Rhodosporidiobolus poonsookiae]